MAEKQDLKDAPVKDELQVAVSQDTSLRKVELDLDDAPFLVEQAPPPPAKTEEAPLQVADEGAEPTKKKGEPRTPAALRERGSGGEALLSEKRPLPQNLPAVNLFGREREGGGFSIREAPSLANSLTLRYLS